MTSLHVHFGGGLMQSKSSWYSSVVSRFRIIKVSATQGCKLVEILYKNSLGPRVTDLYSEVSLF